MIRAVADTLVGHEASSVGEVGVEMSQTAPLIGHGEVVAFATSTVNMPPEAVRDYRTRVNSLRDALETKIAADAAYALVRALQAGSLAKGMALRTTSDFDLAVYVRPD